jgi:hypothetical protein
MAGSLSGEPVALKLGLQVTGVTTSLKVREDMGNGGNVASFVLRARVF